MKTRNTIDKIERTITSARGRAAMKRRESVNLLAHGLVSEADAATQAARLSDDLAERLSARLRTAAPEA